ncbi:MAG: hypothetical protein WCK59_00645 [Candidatus Falkowbacteria bacterium]
MAYFIEIQNFGWNTMTVTAGLIMFFTIVQAYGIICQSKKIWQSRSGESLSATLFFLGCFYFIGFLFYGLSKHSLAMTFNSLLAIPYIPIVIGLIKFKPLTRLEKISLPLTIAIVPLMIMIEEKDVLLLILSLISLVILITQPLEMIKTGKRGAVNIKFILIYLATSIFWLIYSLVISNLVLIMFNLGALVIYALITHLYYKPQKI